MAEHEEQQFAEPSDNSSFTKLAVNKDAKKRLERDRRFKSGGSLRFGRGSSLQRTRAVIGERQG
jgi:hypothetical protein